MTEFTEIFVDGAFRAPHSQVLRRIQDPATLEVVGTAVLADAEDAAAAVGAAQRASRPFSGASVAERQELLAAIARELTLRVDEATDIVVAEVGMPRARTRSDQVEFAATVFESFIDLVPLTATPERIGHSLVVREPAGVAAAITPWNYPLYQIALKAAAALAAGCTIVVKPSELAPLNARVFAEAVLAAGLPPGVVNVVPGLGPIAGEALITDPRVEVISFTGSTRAGRRVAELAARGIKRTSLELGGKSASIVLSDGDLERATRAAVLSATTNSGQNCAATTRLLVPEDRLEVAELVAAGVAESLVVGDPRDPRADLGPLISDGQRRKVLGYIAESIAQGARLVTGGTQRPRGLERGHFVSPTVLSRVEPGSRVAREEVFGPVLTILGYRDEAEALRIEDDTEYGLSAAVWSADEQRALGVARQLRTGKVDINGAGFNVLAPMGGRKGSGIGRELGPHALDEYLELKAIQLPG